MSAPGSDLEAGGFLRHGGRLAAARGAFPDAPAPWLDLSTGVNPRPYPARRADRAALGRLPDPGEVAALEAAAAAAFGVSPDRVAATPGTEAALRALPRVLGARSAAIVSPTYGGHAEAWRLAGAKVSAVSWDEARASAAEAVVLVNPNNPDGARVQDPDAGDHWLIVDEAFVETAPDLSVAPRLFSSPVRTGEGGGNRSGRTIVLRSFGKFYGLPGVRLGFVIAEPGLAARIGAQFGDWPVGAEAIAAGLAAYPDHAWRERARLRLARDAARLDDLLRANGFEILGGTSLFRLAAAPDAPRRFTALARRGVLTRPFSDQSTWLRFGLPKPKDWPRLKAALEGSRR
ncbi:aminotransferase class I/II-fold pyridoxal phosphate-dependent enzyme [Phenylobacterium sp.]|uniref:aminotransferase class I/II-fold pyridoxal phosphate-dependent enzyme n=1 Tax=Phenylobacterium sp. TaxID=1871053 RepID=UPI002896B2D3|nr:aminotransferase class I/II-fold pyridoxal phosphate-dependent enzyme [Phenylobacterium sp.]